MTANIRKLFTLFSKTFLKEGLDGVYRKLLNGRKSSR